MNLTLLETPKPGFVATRPIYLTRLQSVVYHRKYLLFFLFYLDLWVKATQNIAKYPLHYVTYVPAKFEVATSNGLGGDAFTRKYIISPLTLGLQSRSHKILPNTLYIM